ncbi:ATP-binding cassette sub- A member 9 [Phlyctochytrium bullatum]|nr:ATP-binding cassette sub- A member 9 [Phlyctochytrium bullatum]
MPSNISPRKRRGVAVLIRKNWILWKNNLLVNVFLFFLLPALLVFLIGMGRLGLANAVKLGIGNAQRIPTTLSAFSRGRTLVGIADVRPAAALDGQFKTEELAKAIEDAGSFAKVYPDEVSMVSECSKNTTVKCWAGIVVHRGSVESVINYTVYFPSKAIPYFVNVRAGNGGMADFGILSLQSVVDQFVIGRTSGQRATIDLSGVQYSSISNAEVQSSLFGYFYDFLATTGSVSFLVLYLPYVHWLVNGIVMEKELRIKESLSMMGLSTSAYFGSWLASIGLLSILSFVIMGGMLNLVLFPSSDPLSALLFTFIAGWGIVGYALTLSNLFVRARLAGLGAICITFLTGLLGLGVSKLPSSFLYRAVSMVLFPPTTVVYGVVMFSRSEQNSSPVSIAKWFSSDNDQGLPFVAILIFGLVGGALQFLLAWYLDQVIVLKGGFGTARHPLFFLGQAWKEKPDVFDGSSEMQRLDAAESLIESLPQGSNVAIKIRNLKKRYPGAAAWSVKATIGLITGMTPVTSGDVTVYGHSILTAMQEIRQLIGVCPQHDILWDDLSVEQTLQVFAAIKGIPKDEVEDEITMWLEQIGIPEKRNKKIRTLSGGQKRKVSVCIAFMGGSKVVLLDEPTAGVDPYSRRAMWKIISQNKAGRTIIFTTHFMDEADILSDRVAIMEEGSLKAYGTSLFLRGKVGLGYCLNISLSGHPSVTPELVYGHVNQLIHDATLLESSNTELSIRIPLASNGEIPDLLRSLKSVGVTNYSLSTVTLQDVFLRLIAKNGFSSGAQAEEPIDDALRGSLNRLSVTGREHARKVSDINQGLVKGLPPGAISQYGSLFFKRLLIAKSDWKMQLLPVAIAAVGVFGAYFALKDKAKSGCPTVIAEVFPRFNVTMPGSFDLYALPQTSRFFNASKLRIVQGTLADLSALQSRNVSLMQSIIGGAFVEQENFGSATLAYDVNKPFSAPATVNALSNARMSSLGISGMVSSSIQGFPVTKSTFDSGEWTMHLVAGFFMLITASVAVPLISILTIVRERETKVKDLQRFSGVTAGTYWGANLTWDVLYGIFIAAVFAGGLNLVPVWNAPFALSFVVFFLFSVTTSLLGFVMSFGFQTPSTGLMAVFGYLFMTAIGAFTAYIVIFTSPDSESSYTIADYISYSGYAVTPAFSVLHAVFLGTNFLYSQCQKDNKLDPANMWKLNSMGGIIAFLGAQIVILAVTVIILENWDSILLRRMAQNARKLNQQGGFEDSDDGGDEEVVAEKERVAFAVDAKSDKVIVQQLWKQYGDQGKVAVKDVSLGIKKNECFVLLGTNGAGKTSTLKIICGQQLPTSGTVQVDSHDLLTDHSGLQRSIGVTPQFDSLWPQLTPDEHLNLFARIRGVPVSQRRRSVDWLIRSLDLEAFRNTPAGALSGGNRRKLSLALALVGSPEVLILDEPSTGMDPASKRSMWSVILSLRSRLSIILTTHSMEEAEALAAQHGEYEPSRIGIMVAGRVKALGSHQRLQNRHGKALQIQATCGGTEDVDLLVSRLQQRFGGDAVRMLESHQGTVSAEVQTQNGQIKLEDVFEAMETSKHESRIENYQIGQTTLEQIFIQFASNDPSSHMEESEAITYWGYATHKFTWVSIIHCGIIALLESFMIMSCVLPIWLIALFCLPIPFVNDRLARVTINILRLVFSFFLKLEGNR